MYSQEIVDRRIHARQRSLPFKLRRYSIDESIERQEALNSLWNYDRKEPIRPLSGPEQEFVLNEMVLSQLDYNYWAPRYAFLVTKNGELKRIAFWESQLIAIAHVAKGEEEAWRNKTDNLWCWLKARQLGATQVCESMIAHRLFFYENQRGAVASDKPDNSILLSRRIEFIYKKLPWWMRPHMGEKVKGVEMVFDHLNSLLLIGHGSSEGGGLAQGQSINIFHLTEIPDWKNWQQIDEDFLPTVPLLPTSVGFAESTARGRHDHWHAMFELAWSGRSRWKALFIPWYAEEHTYVLRPPEGWEPDKLTKEHAKKVEKTSPMYCFGRTVRLSPNQMYWWERTYQEYKENGRLHIFFQEYASDHLEAFQAAGLGLFPQSKLAVSKQHAIVPRMFEICSS